MKTLLTRLVTLLIVSAFLTGGTATAETPNILIVLVDDMGYGDPGCYNPDSKIPTPHIDSLAREGMRFTDAHAPGALCHPSRFGLLTGQYPFRTDVGQWRRRPTIKEGQTTIASLLRTQGYRTAMVGKWHLGFQENGYDKTLAGGPVDRGFDTYFGIRASTDIPPYFYIRGNHAVLPPTEHIEANDSAGWSPIQGAFWRAGGIAPNLRLKDVLPRFTEEAVKIIGDHAKADTQKPLMLYLAYPAPHTPWLPSPEFQGRSKAGMYGDFLVMVDEMIGRVLKALEKAGMANDTLVIFSSDNGPVWYDRDVERFGHDASGGLRGMKGDAWENGHRMPFLVRWPGRVRAGSVSHQTICFTDMLATFASVTGADLPADAGPDSFSILPVLLGEQREDEPIRGSLVIPSANGTMTIRSGPWKLITALGSGGFSKPGRIKPTAGGPKGQLYNLVDDRGETNNLYLQRPAIVKRLSDELARIQRSDRTREEVDRARQQRPRRNANRNRTQGDQQRESDKPQPTFENVAYGKHERHVLDFWQAVSDPPTPVFIWIHGGGFRGGNKSSFPVALLKPFLDAGVSCAAIHYRLSGHAPYPAQMHDSARAIQFIRSKAKVWNIDPTRLAAGGGSAGSGISQWLAFREDMAKPHSEDPIARQSTRLTCALPINMQSTYDPRVIRRIIPGDAYKNAAFIPFYARPQDWNWDKDEIDDALDALLKDASPITHLTRDDPPVFLIHYERSNKPGNIHHSNFGRHLKEAMDRLEIECIRKMDKDYPSMTDAYADMVRFVIKQFDRSSQE
ncbi:MAG: sulfatase-like hydrolase/transferase [Planctomycetes bacterium]|nr:sulfatase-like hydrolase/transferase [Planctomycetota bacterium]